MSASVSKVAGEMATPAPAFSYAQAAKGRSPSLPATVHSSKSSSDAAEPTQRSASAAQTPASNERDKSYKDSGVAGQENCVSNVNDELAKADNSPESSTSTVTHATHAHQPDSEAQSQIVPSAPSSPSYDTTSTSTLPKEDDAFANSNGSSESTSWDKISQSSQNGEKPGDKADGDEEDSKLSSWEHVTVNPQLKEAPPPTFNIWKQRAMEKQAKADKDKPSLSTGHSNQSKDAGQARGTAKGEFDGSKAENKKKAKPGTPGDEKAGSGFRDAAKSTDGKPRNAEEADKKPYNGARLPEPHKSSPAIPPPPPEDAISWPTPDSAQGEEKKKLQDRSEKGEKEKPASGKPHGKEKWVPVPYVPSAVFNTPLPPGRRGGRLARGGRENVARGGHAPHSSIGGEKISPSPASATATPTTTNDRGRGDMGPPRGGALSSRPKRAASAGPPTSREQRKGPDSPSQEKRNDTFTASVRPVQNDRRPSVENSRMSTATQTDGAQFGRHFSDSGARNDSQGGRRSLQNGGIREQTQQGISQDHAHPRSVVERRTDTMRPLEPSRESNGFGHPRDRGEGRPDRGRGGYHGRGNHNGYNNTYVGSGPHYSTGTSNQSSLSYAPVKSHSYTERHGSQSQAAAFPVSGRESRHYRSSSRSQSIPNQTGYGRFPNSGLPAGGQNLPPLQTDIANIYGYQPGHPAIMSAMSWNPYVEQIQLLGMVQMQLEYYFSVDNLCKDMFLRKHMDSQGFVFLRVILNFNRIKQLTTDADMVRYVGRNSPLIEVQVGEDSVDRIRKAEGWEQWVLVKDERDITVQNDSPVQFQQTQHVPSASWGPSYRGQSGNDPVSPRESFFAAQNRMDAFGFQSFGEPVPHAVPPMTDSTEINPVINGQITQTPLSATVPDFTPGLQSVNSQPLQSQDPTVPSTSGFLDEQVENLMILIRKPTNPVNPLRPPFPSATSRTFSNGSIDGRAIHDELFRSNERQIISTVNGDGSSESRDLDDSQRPRSPLTFGSAPRQPSSVAPQVFWVKDEQNPIGDLPDDVDYERYTVFRQTALKHREESTKGQCHRDMEILYQFLSHFLVRNFNPRMYEEFQRLACEDANERGSTIGVQNLVQYYDESLLGLKIISSDLLRDYVDFVKAESSKEDRIAFPKLRAAWRNGALNFKNRVKLDKFIDADLKAELER